MDGVMTTNMTTGTTTGTTTDLTTDAVPHTPARFDRDPAWGRRFARGLGWYVRGDKEPTPTERRRCAAAVLAVDGVGAALARAIRDDHTVTMAQFRAALAGGIDAVEDPAPELVAFFDAVTATPDWLDRDRLDRGGRVCLRGGRTSLDVLGTGALMNGYRSSATTRQLVATGRLAGDDALQRVTETSRWWYECVRPGGLEPGARGWQLTVHVRLMHALVNHHLAHSPDWDVAEWGSPVNQADQVATLGLFSTSFLIQSRALGRIVTAREGGDAMHLWRYVGWLIGVDPAWLTDSEAVGRRYLYHLARFAPGPDDASLVLAGALRRAWGQQNHPWATALRRRLDVSRLLGLQLLFAGRAGVQELGLPVVAPWSVPLAILGNLATSLPAAGFAGAERLEHRHGTRYVDGWLARNERASTVAG